MQLARIIHEHFCRNRRSLNQARRARRGKVRGSKFSELRTLNFELLIALFALVVRRCGILQRTVMNHAGWSEGRLLNAGLGLELLDYTVQSVLMRGGYRQKL